MFFGLDESNMGSSRNVLAHLNESKTSTHLGAYGGFGVPLGLNLAGFPGPAVHEDFGTAPYPSHASLFEQQSQLTFPSINASATPYSIGQPTNIFGEYSAKKHEDLLLKQLMPSQRQNKKIPGGDSARKREDLLPAQLMPRQRQDKQRKHDKECDNKICEGEKPQDAFLKMDLLFNKTLTERLNGVGLDGEAFVKETRTKMYDTIEEDIKRDTIVCLNADRASLQRGATNQALLKVRNTKCWKYVCIFPLSFFWL